MPDLTAYTGLIGVVIGGCITLLGVRLTQQQQYRLEVLRDRQALRNATRGRLGETYTTVLLAAATMDAPAQRALSLWGNKVQVQALNEELRALSAELNRAGVRVLLEQEATDVKQPFNAVRQAFIDFQNHYLIFEQDLASDRPKQVDEVMKRRDELAARVGDPRNAMLRSLAPLDEPIAAVAHERRSWLPWRR